MRHQYVTAGLISLVLTVGFAIPALAARTRSQDPPPRFIGKEPLATAPYAQNDPVPKLKLQPHPQPTTNREVAETFLALLANGYDAHVEGCPGGSLPGDPAAFEAAWRMLGPARPTLKAFLANWAGTVRIGIIQLEEIDPQNFFVELERVAWHQGSWTVSYYTGQLTVERGEAGSFVAKFEPCTEPLVAHNIGGHQGWQHSLMVMVGHRDRGFEVKEVRYEGRTATVLLRRRESGEEMTLRFARIVEGTWVFLTRSLVK